MHVGGGEGDVAQGGHGEPSAVPFPPGHGEPPRVGGDGIQPVVAKGLALEKRAAVAMKAVGAPLPAHRVEFGVKQRKPALFLGGQLHLAAQAAVEARIERDQGQQELLQAAIV